VDIEKRLWLTSARKTGDFPLAFQNILLPITPLIADLQVLVAEAI